MNKVKVIIANVEHFATDVEKMLPTIAPCYIEKYHKHKIPKDKLQEVVSGFLLKQYLGVERDEQLKRNEYEKPYLAEGSTYFNLSHSENYVVLAIADCEVGVDTEKIRSCHDATVKKVFSEKQKAELSKLDGEAKDEAFTRIWTECESVLKLRGIGFANGWGNIPVDECKIHVQKTGEYYIACATDGMAEIEIEEL